LLPPKPRGPADKQQFEQRTRIHGVQWATLLMPHGFQAVATGRAAAAVCWGSQLRQNADLKGHQVSEVVNMTHPDVGVAPACLAC
jgi:hypothetical protein